MGAETLKIGAIGVALLLAGCQSPVETDTANRNSGSLAFQQNNIPDSVYEFVLSVETARGLAQYCDEVRILNTNINQYWRGRVLSLSNSGYYAKEIREMPRRVRSEKFISDYQEYFRSAGLVPGDNEKFCAVAHSEMEARSDIGRFLGLKG
ncbi:DUF5333 family protein [Ruegeria sp. MALMAid1280]|uniref:DUF5333 family protein n=1 Tax=Ruegeria sp. MALMAid1280 TaxID=3411634 RepID=UPI003BA1F5D8